MKHVKPEKDIQKEIVKLVRSKGLMCERINAGLVKMGRYYMHLANEGHPDINIYLSGGKILFLEVKTETGQLSPAQVEYHEQLRLRGHQVEVVRDIKHVENLLADLGY